MKYNKLGASLFFAGMLLLSGCGSSDDPTTPPAATTPPAETTPPASTTPPVSEKAVLESTTIVTTDGEVIRVDRTAGGLIFEGHEGKIVLLEIYGDTCPHCKDAIPAYNRLQAKYPNDVYVITIESYGQLNNAGLQQYVAANGMQYDTVSKENSGKMFSFIQTLTGYNTNQGVPVLLVLSRDGDLAEYLPPQILNEAYVDGLIQGLL